MNIIKKTSGLKNNLTAWLMGSIILSTGFLTFPAYSAPLYKVGAGVVHQWGPTSVSGTQPSNAVCNAASTRNDILGGIYGDELVQTSDGLWGIEVGEDIVILLEGNASVTSTQYPDPRGFSITYGQRPVALNTQSRIGINGEATIGINPSRLSNGSNISGISYNGIFSAQLYIGPKAEKDDYQTWQIDFDACLPQDDIIVPSGWDFAVGDPPLVCSISTPPTIDFGQVNITGRSANSLLASKSQAIDINCTSEDPDSTSKKMTVSFTGNYSGTYTSRLKMTNSTGEEMAYIRGRYLDDSGSCDGDSVNEIGFNGSSGIKTLSNIKTGALTVPMTWSLCSNGSKLYGEGSAQATVNIDWD